MRLEWKSLLLGAAAAVLGMGALGAAGFFLLFTTHGGPQEQRHRTLRLASGRSLEVISLHLAYGDDHSGRGSIDDGLCVEYVTAAADDAARELEANEVFQAIRPMAESLGLPSAEVSAFPTLVRKGRYQVYARTRGAGGAWSSKVVEAKVFVND